MIIIVLVGYIEKLCEQMPPRQKLIMPNLQQYLKICWSDKINEAEKVYLVYYWVAHNIDYDFKKCIKRKESNSSPDSMLKLGQSIYGGYSYLFHDLITNLGIQLLILTALQKFLESKLVRQFQENKPST
jgi:hypothetical protein